MIRLGSRVLVIGRHDAVHGLEGTVLELWRSSVLVRIRKRPWLPSHDYILPYGWLRTLA